MERYTYQTESNVLCLKLVTDGTTSFKGFNATYTKFYNGTDIKGGWLLSQYVNTVVMIEFRWAVGCMVSGCHSRP